MEDLGQGTAAVPAAARGIGDGRPVIVDSFSLSTEQGADITERLAATTAGMFATTLRSRRARQKSALPPLRWLPRYALGRGGTEKVLGAQVDMSQLWLAVPRRTLRKSRRKSLGQQQREFDTDLIAHACAQAANWSEDMRLMVSLEDDQAPDADFNTRLNSVLAESGFPVGRLDLVFQESGLATDDCETCLTLSTLRDLGAQIFLGGFGTAPSSLSLLRERAVGGLLDGVQFDVALLAPSVVTWPQTATPPPFDDGAAAFYRAALEAVKALGLKVRSVGVDQPELLSFVQKTGCSEASGTMFALPETTAQIAERFEDISGRPRRRRMARTAEGL